MTFRFAYLAAVWLLTSVAPAVAEGCNAYLFPSSVAEVTLARVQPARLPILVDGDGCPAAGTSCDSKSYLVAGDQVLVSGAHGAYRCATFISARKQSTGWIASAAVVPLPQPKTPDTWSGLWKRQQGHASLTIRKQGAGCFASGLATYAVSPTNVRTGVASGRLKESSFPWGIVARFGIDGSDQTPPCTVEIRQIGPWLVVNDGATEDANSACGGMGVTFNGVYQRVR